MEQDEKKQELLEEKKEDGQPESQELSLEEQLKAVREERDKYYNNWLRAEAELDNYKKRVAKEKEEFRKFAIENFAKEILTPLDYLEMAINHAKTSQNVEALIQGVEYTYKCLLDILKNYDIVPVPSLGQRFDPALHEAHEIIESEEVPEGTIVKEHRKAYKMCGRLLRAGIVSVAKSPQEIKEESKQNETNENKED